MKKILIDTNAYSRFLAGDENVLNALTEAHLAYMSIFVMGELFAGFKGGFKERENKNLLERFLQKPTIKMLNTTTETAKIFGMIKNNLKKAGTPLPINDIWIASHALETGSVLVTYDAHFRKITGLRLWSHIGDMK